jgi:GT2 family glycosyltransferase
VLLLNNDCLVTTGWLRRLLRALDSDPRIGLAGPSANCVSGAQQVEVRYDDLAGLDGFAWDWGKTHNRGVEDTDRLVGFCLLLRREVIDRIGLFDERFGLGCFEDDDYCVRALRAGFRAVIARDAFVHHFGGQTFRGAGVDLAAQLRHNQELFRAKWAEADRAEPEQRPTAYEVGLGERGGLRLERPVPLISLCMIVRDAARTIAACLQSIRPWVDEMIVVDTGSQDETPDIVRRLGARLFHFPWCDSFSAGRNESLRHARGRWLFWMDADDTIDAANGRKLRELAQRPPHPSVLGYVMQVHCPGPGEEGQDNVTVVDHVKLFRNLPELRFERRIHEQIIPAIRRAAGELEWTDVFVVHSGYDHSPAGQQRKLQRDLHLLYLELAEEPEHPFTLFNLGMTCADVGRFTEAEDFLRRSLKASAGGETHLRKVYSLLVYSLDRLGRAEEAWRACEDGLRQFPKDAELLFRRAALLHEAGRLQEAERAYQAVLATEEEAHFRSMVRGIKGFLARQNLADVYARLGDLPRAEEQWRRVVAEVPRYQAGWNGLNEVLRRQGKLAEALGPKALPSSGLVLAVAAVE